MSSYNDRAKWTWQGRTAGGWIRLADVAVDRQRGPHIACCGLEMERLQDELGRDYLLISSDDGRERSPVILFLTTPRSIGRLADLERRAGIRQ